MHGHAYLETIWNGTKHHPEPMPAGFVVRLVQLVGGELVAGAQTGLAILDVRPIVLFPSQRRLYWQVAGCRGSDPWSRNTRGPCLELRHYQRPNW